jgi:hypothetical protein
MRNCTSGIRRAGTSAPTQDLTKGNHHNPCTGLYNVHECSLEVVTYWLRLWEL